MNQQELRAALAAVDGKVVVSGGKLTANIDRLLADCYDNQPLAITEAQAGPGDGEGGAVVIAGRSTFLGVPDARVTARFSADGGGQVQAAIRYDLIGEMPGPDRWTFQRSLPSLPPVMSYGAPAVRRVDQDPGTIVDPLAGQSPYLAALDLFSSSYVVSTQEAEDPSLGVTLKYGINFVGRMRPEGALGVLRRTFGESDPLLLHGTVRVPKSTEVTVPLEERQYPWHRQNVPGVLLEASLGKGGALGGVRFENPRLLIYSPHHKDWLQKNPTFEPRIAYTGTLSLPGAGISVDATALVRWGLDEALLFGAVEGVSLAKLGSLAEAAGGDDLMANLPDPLQKAGQTLGKLSLTWLWLQLSLGRTGLHVGGVGFDIGIPDFKWKIWGDHLAVENLGCDFSIQNPFGPPPGEKSPAPRKVIAGLYGTVDIEGAPVRVRASNANGFTVNGRLEKGQTVSFKKLLSSWAPDVPPPADLTIDALSVTLSPSSYCAMSMALASRPNEWVIDVGPGKLKMSDVAFSFRRPQGGKATGSFAGTIAFGKYATIATRFDVPGGFEIRGIFPKINLTHLVETLCDQKVPLPSGFDLVLENASLLIQKQNDTFKVLVGTTIGGFGAVAFEVRKVPGSGWCYAAGLSMGSSSLSRLPGLGGLKSIEDSFKLQKLLMVVSSFEDAGFTFPDMAQFNRPQLATQKLAMPSQASGVVKGLMLFAEWQLDPGSKQQSLVKSLLGLGGTQSATIAIGADPLKDFRLYVRQRSTIQKQPFDCKFGVELANGKPSLFLTGSLTTKIQGQPQTFDVTTAFATGGAFLSATMKGTTAVSCGPFKLSNLALQIGVNWAGIPSLGVAATIDVKSFTSSVAVFFDSTDPSRSLVAGSISNVTAKDVMGAFLPGVNTPIDEVLKGIAIRGTHEFSIGGDLADELDGLEAEKVSSAFALAKVTIPASAQQLSIVPKQKGASWHLTDLTTMRHYQLEKKGNQIRVQVAPQFYFAPQPTFIGTIKFPQAFYLNAAISFAGFDAAATVDIAQNKGLSVQAQMDKVVILDEKLFSLTALQGPGGPKIDVSTFSQPEHQVAEFRQPHFYVNGALTLLGLKKGIYASVSTQGVDFELVGQLVPGVRFDVDARFGKRGFEASGRVKVGVGTVDLGALGKAKINTELEVELDVDLDSDNKGVSVAAGKSYGADAILLSHDSARLVFQGDGNLVLYKTTGGPWVPLWASNTGGRGGKSVSFQGDGNLVIYADGGRPVWASSTSGQGFTMTLRGDGNLAIYDGAGNARWQTGTSVGGEDQAAIELETSLVFAGEKIHIPKFKLDPRPDTFTKLPETISKKVEGALKDVFKDMNKWANAVKNGAMDGVNDTAKVFKDVYGKSEKEAKELANSMSKGVSSASKAVENTAKDVAKSTEKTAKKAYKKAKFW